VRTASKAMGALRRDVYRPDPAAADAYDRLYAEYRGLHDYFGRGSESPGHGGGNDVMHRLKDIRREALAREGLA
jgi:L-ribulokinase